MASSHFLPLLVGVETANYLMLTGKVRSLPSYRSHGRQAHPADLVA